jgi:hypothetical protein
MRKNCTGDASLEPETFCTERWAYPRLRRIKYVALSLIRELHITYSDFTNVVLGLFQFIISSENFNSSLQGVHSVRTSKYWKPQILLMP